MQESSDHFYEELPVIDDFSGASDFDNYHDLPRDWHVVATDIVNSTTAIQNDNYKSVNILGASPIAAMLNLTDKNAIPFVFGGDGSLLCIPPSLLKEAKEILASCRNIGTNAYNLELRAAIIPVSFLNEKNKQLKVARFRASEHFTQALFIGEGVAYSDYVLKSGDFARFHITESKTSSLADFRGLECRWKEVTHSDKEVITLLVYTNPGWNKSEDTYTEVIEKLRELFGFDFGTNPIDPAALSMHFSVSELAGETKLRTFGMGFFERLAYILKTEIEILAGKIFMKLGYKSSKTDWNRYKSDLALNSDYRKFDDMLRIVITGTTGKRKELEKYLRQRHEKSELAFGLHVTDAAMVTCMVFQYHRDHIHFVDGSKGGYVMASKQLKKQVKKLESRTDWAH